MSVSDAIDELLVRWQELRRRGESPSVGELCADHPSLAEELRQRIAAFPDPVQAEKDFIARQPMGRLGSVEDITGILVFLASDESMFATGNMYSIDGGMTI